MRYSIFSILIVSWLLAACGGESSSTNPPPNSPPIEDIAPEDISLDEEALTVSGVSETSFNKSAVDINFLLEGADFDLNKDEVNLSVNESKVESSDLNISAEKISVSLELEDGKNELTFKAYDSIGRPLYKNMTLWSGTNAIEVVVVDEQGAPFLKPVDLKVSLSDDPNISSSGTTSTGSLIFPNIPSRTIIVEAFADNNIVGTSAGVGNDGKIIVQMLSFKATSSIVNNDFSLGTSGWDVGNAPTVIVPHEEDIILTPLTAKLTQAASLPAQRANTNLLKKEALNKSLEVQLAAIENNDLQLTTSGEGKQSISRTFPVKPGTTSVKVRYRFITSEVPGGFFGSQFNDFFSVSVRSKSKGLVSNESNTMNSLGLGAFNQSTGSTAWRIVSVPTNPEADEVQIDVSVGNVGDSALDSSVIIDYVGEEVNKVTPTLSWDGIKGGIKLGYEVKDGPLTEATKIKLYWASGKNISTKIGDAFFEFTVPSGATGIGSPISVAGSSLKNNPDNTSYIIAAVSDTEFFALGDVQLAFGPNADQTVVPDNMIDIIKDGLRAAGVPKGTISSTARKPADQARAMFQNLVNPKFPIDINIQNQLNLYKAPGDAVVNIFVTLTKNMTLTEILAQTASIRASMEEEIVSQGPENVSKHCSDPAQRSVVDVASQPFSTTNGAFFESSATPRVTKFIDERKDNGAYHLELKKN